MGIVSKATFKRRCEHLDNLLDDIQMVYGKCCCLERHALPYKCGVKRSNFWRNYHYKFTLELLRAAAWVFWHLAKSKIAEYKKDERQKLKGEKP